MTSVLSPLKLVLFSMYILFKLVIGAGRNCMEVLLLIVAEHPFLVVAEFLVSYGLVLQV
jgi:hypothetical protein